MKGLTQGRIVHWVDGERMHWAAVVVCVIRAAEGEVELYVFPATSGAHLGKLMVASYDGKAMPYTWHWIEAV